MVDSLENLDFDDPTPIETEKQQALAEQTEFENLYAGELEARANPMYQKYKQFLDTVNQTGIDVERIFESPNTKRAHIKSILGYTALTGRGGKAVRLDEAKDARIGRAYLSIYNRARKLIGPHQ